MSACPWWWWGVASQSSVDVNILAGCSFGHGWWEQWWAHHVGGHRLCVAEEDAALLVGGGPAVALVVLGETRGPGGADGEGRDIGGHDWRDACRTGRRQR